MKNHPRDFIFGFSLLVLFLTLSAIVSFFWFEPVLPTAWGAYRSILTLAVFSTTFGLLCAITSRILLALWPLTPGEYDCLSLQGTYFKMLTMMQYFGFRALFLWQIEPMMPVLYRLFGAKIGANVAIGGQIDSPFLVEIGSNSVLGRNSIVTANIINAGRLLLGPVRIGEDVTVGAFSMVMPKVEIQDGATLSPASIVNPQSIVPKGETWRGHPARRWM